MTRFRIRLLAALLAAAVVFGFGSSVASADPGGAGTSGSTMTSASVYDSSDGGSTQSADPGGAGTDQ